MHNTDDKEDKESMENRFKKNCNKLRTKEEERSTRMVSVLMELVRRNGRIMSV